MELQLRSFVDGDVHALIAFTERYEQTATVGRYVLVNELGDGRALRDKPSVTRETTAATRFGVRFSRAPIGFGAVNSQELGIVGQP